MLWPLIPSYVIVTNCKVSFIGYRDKHDKIEVVTVKGGDTMEKWVCTYCGYIYNPAVGDPDNGVAAGTPFEKLPDDWRCPECGAEKEDFEKYAG